MLNNGTLRSTRLILNFARGMLHEVTVQSVSPVDKKSLALQQELPT